jgi:hypothetical protein
VKEVSEETLFFTVEAVLQGQFRPDRPLTPLESGMVAASEEDRVAVVEE